MWENKWVIGNWKMNGRLNHNQSLVNALTSLTSMKENKTLVGIAVPSIYLLNCIQSAENSQLVIGAEDVSQFGQDGAFTGEISAPMLKDVGAKFSLIGHSERRLYFNETNEILKKKWENCIDSSLIPILCVGESAEDRNEGREEIVVEQQLSILKNLKSSVNQIVIAYEPVWAIGTGQVATIAQIAKMHHFIYGLILSFFTKDVKIRVLYGGSVSAENATDIFSISHVDGALVGGASLKSQSFSAIIDSAQSI